MKVFQTTRAIILFVCLGLFCSAMKTPLADSETAATGSLPPIIFVEAPTIVPGKLTGRFPRGSHLARFRPGNPPKSAVNLTPGFFAAADPQVSFNATSILFSAQKTRGARWQIWEMKTDGSDMRQITHASADCFRPAYLPRNQIVFTMVSGKAAHQFSTIYVSQLSGAGPHPITFGPGDFQVETVLKSGRILVSAKSSLVGTAQGSNARVFYTLRPDGSGLSLFRRNRKPDAIRTGATELGDGTILFVKRYDPAGKETGGQLAWIQSGAMHNSVITQASSVFGSAHVLDGSRLIVGKEDSGPSAASSKYSLYTFNLATRTVGKAIYANAKLSAVDAVPLEPHPVPLYYRSILHPDRNYGRVVCLDSYISADAPHGRLTGHIARVRVIALQPDHKSERVLGDAPVESDGSFYIKVPADHPIRFELLDTRGDVMHAQKSWIWARTGEDVPCLGCHENKALVPADRWPLALKRLDAPIPVGVTSTKPSANH